MVVIVMVGGDIDYRLVHLSDAAVVQLMFRTVVLMEVCVVHATSWYVAVPSVYQHYNYEPEKLLLDFRRASSRFNSSLVEPNVGPTDDHTTPFLEERWAHSDSLIMP